MKSDSKRKTILRLAPYPTKEESGRGLHPYELSKMDNCKIIYLTFFKNNADYFDIPNNVKLHIGSFYTDAYPRRKSLLKRILFSLYRLAKILFFSIHGIYLMIKYRVDIVHIHSAMFSIVAMVSKIFNRKTYITFHGADFFRIENALWYRFFANYFDAVFSISPRFIKKLSKIHRCKVIQVYNGIETNIYKNFNLERKKQILSVTHFKKQKGIKFLIEGYNLFLTKYPGYTNYNLVIAGHGILMNEMKLMIEKMNLEDKISLVGQKNRDELIRLYNDSEIFVLPSIWEGFAKVLVEAMSCGCKIISTKVDSAPLLLGNWGYMINHSKPEEICDSIHRVIIDSNYPFSNQTLVLKKFTWDNIRSMYSEIIFKSN